jgi:hypothetical protein
MIVVVCVWVVDAGPRRSGCSVCESMYLVVGCCRSCISWLLISLSVDCWRRV